MLRPYQNQAVASLRQLYADGFSAPLFCLPTGGGKTFVFCFIAQQMVARGRRACILVHRQELLGQASRSLLAMGVPHGIIAPGYRTNGEAIQVASVQTLANRLKKADERERKLLTFDLIIIDEAHHAVAGTWRRVIEGIPSAKILGVTATPIRTDGRGLGIKSGGCFDSMVVGPTIGELIKWGFLVKPVVFAPPSKIDLSTVHMRGGDFANGELAAAVDKPTITGDAVTHYARLCPHKPAIAFCASVAHAHHVAEQFRAVGFSAAALDGTASDTERRGIINSLGNGGLDVVASCDLISEGTDIPVVEAAILLRPTLSTGLYLQQVGRALRPADGKSRALILDHVGNCLTHGLPDDDREWSLDGAQKKKRKSALPEIKLKQCQNCYAFHEFAPICPECGHVYETKERAIEQVEGTLRELTKEEIEAIRKKNRREQGKARTLEDLISLAKSKGYRNPMWWAQKVFNSRGGHQKHDRL